MTSCLPACEVILALGSHVSISLAEELPQRPLPFMAQIVAEQPFIEYLLPSFNFPPGEELLRQIDLDRGAKSFFNLLTFFQINRHSLRSDRPPLNLIPTQLLSPHQPPELPPHLLPKTNKLPQTRVTMSLPIPDSTRIGP